MTLRRLSLIVTIGALALFGGTALASNGDTTKLCATKGGTIKLPKADGSCKNSQTEIAVASGDAIAALTARVEALEDLLSGVVRDGSTLRLEGMNLQVVNSTGATTGTENGLGNVIVGYNGDNGDTKTGSHNLVIGDGHTYTSSAGIVAGAGHTLTGTRAAVIGGLAGTASGDNSFVGGGQNNVASGNHAFVGGGDIGIASGTFAFVGGGLANTASGNAAFVGGGEQHQATGVASFIGGGSASIAGPGTCAWLASINVVGPC